MEAIDRAATKFGMPMGPLTLTDLVGLDTAVLCRQGGGRGLSRPGGDLADPGRDAQGRARGDKKSLMKFWLDRQARSKPRAEPGRRWRSSPSTGPARRRWTEDEITDRLFLPMLLEATRVLEEGIVREPGDVDMGLILGIGFPPFRGGILRWCDSSGAGAVVEKLAKYAPLGKRFEPTESLLRLAKTGETFYPRPKLGCR